jgi:excisionase family DNA binding protein
MDMTYMTTAELADMMRTTTNTVHYWRASGTGPRALKVGKRVLYDVADVDEWIAARKTPADTRAAS